MRYAFIAGIPLDCFYEMSEKIIKVKISINEKTICFFSCFYALLLRGWRIKIICQLFISQNKDYYY